MRITNIIKILCWPWALRLNIVAGQDGGAVETPADPAEAANSDESADNTDLHSAVEAAIGIDFDDDADEQPDPDDQESQPGEGGDGNDEPEATEIPLPEDQQEAYSALSETAQAAVQQILHNLSERSDEPDLALTDEQEAAIEALPEAERAAVRDLLNPYLGQAESSEPAETDHADDTDLRDLDPKTRQRVQEILNKRIGKVAAQRKKAEVERDEAVSVRASLEASNKAMEAKFGELMAQRIVPAPTRENPLSTLNSVDQLDSFAAQVEPFVDWLEENPDGGSVVVPGESAERELSAQDVIRIKLDLNRKLRAVPVRRQYLQQAAAVEQQLVAAVPDLADPNSELSLIVNKTLATLPAMKALPTYKGEALAYSIGLQLIRKHGLSGAVGLLKDQAAANKGRQAIPTAKPAGDATNKRRPVNPKPMPVTRRASPPQQNLTAARRQALQTKPNLSTSDLADLIEDII